MTDLDAACIAWAIASDKLTQQDMPAPAELNRRIWASLHAKQLVLAATYDHGATILREDKTPEAV